MLFSDVHSVMCVCVCAQEMIESIRESVVYMAHTHDGARVAMQCLWHGTAKVFTHTVPITVFPFPVIGQTISVPFQDRKIIIKTMKTYMVKFATVSVYHWFITASLLL